MEKKGVTLAGPGHSLKIDISCNFQNIIISGALPGCIEANCQRDVRNQMSDIDNKKIIWKNVMNPWKCRELCAAYPGCLAMNYRSASNICIPLDTTDSAKCDNKAKKFFTAPATC